MLLSVGVICAMDLASLIGQLNSLFGLIKGGKDFLGGIARRVPKPSPATVLEHRRKWRSEFEQYLTEWHASRTGGDVIIRDISRMDLYPDVGEKGTGTSSWFKAELKGLYHRGIEVFLRVIPLPCVQSHEGWHLDKRDESRTVNAYLVGRIPFDVVRHVEWDGDEYYRFLHIYCDFPRGQPYEDFVIYEIRQGVDPDCLAEIARFNSMRKVLKHLGISH